jgi:hypothetical protein
MTTAADPSKGDGDKPGEGETKPEALADTKPEATPGEKKGKPLIGRTAAVGIGIGSAALVAALLYASRHKPGQRQD